jgi:hypothetical protein
MDTRERVTRDTSLKMMLLQHFIAMKRWSLVEELGIQLKVVSGKM